MRTTTRERFRQAEPWIGLSAPKYCTSGMYKNPPTHPRSIPSWLPLPLSNPTIWPAFASRQWPADAPLSQIPFNFVPSVKRSTESDVYSLASFFLCCLTRWLVSSCASTQNVHPLGESPLLKYTRGQAVSRLLPLLMWLRKLLNWSTHACHRV